MPTYDLSWCDRWSNQRWSPWGRPWPRGRPHGHILKSLALASRPQVLENWPVLGSRTALFFKLLKFCGALEKFFGKRVFVEIAWKIFEKTFFFWDRLKIFCEDLFFWRALALVSLVLGLGLEHSCSWPRECLSSERLFLALPSDFFLCWASNLASLTPPLVATMQIKITFLSSIFSAYHNVWRCVATPFSDSTCYYSVTMHLLMLWWSRIKKRMNE